MNEPLDSIPTENGIVYTMMTIARLEIYRFILVSLGNDSVTKIIKKEFKLQLSALFLLKSRIN